MIAALYVEEQGVYAGLPDVEVWGASRDARLYAGPHAVVCHPPCERWGRYYSGGPSARVKKKRGDDGGCFAAALAAVRKFGGVLEHPADSSAWDHFGLRRPQRGGWWEVADWQGGWTCCVSQGNYGHPAQKDTWLYACHVALPSLKWGGSGKRVRLDEGYASTAARKEARARGVKPMKRIGERERIATPLPFRDLLLSMARTVTESFEMDAAAISKIRDGQVSAAARLRTRLEETQDSLPLDATDRKP